MLNGFRLDFSTRLLNRSGSGQGIFNPFNFDPNTNPTRPDLFDSPTFPHVVIARVKQKAYLWHVVPSALDDLIKRGLDKRLNLSLSIQP